MKYLKSIKQFKAFGRLYNWINPFRGTILMLHRVVTELSLMNDNRLLEITPEFLEKIILQYQSAGCEFVSLDNMLKMQKFHSDKPYVCFTFDDGYRDNLSLALPVFEKYQVPFAVYVTTDFINQQSFLWWYILEDIIIQNEEVYLSNGESHFCRTLQEKNETFNAIKQVLKKNPIVTEHVFYQYLDARYQSDNYKQPEMLNWEDVRILQRSGLCTIASHGVSHSSLTIVSDDVLNFELRESKKIIEEKTGTMITHFAYPYGDMNKKVATAVKNSGYFSAVKIDGGMQRKFQHSYFLKRSWLYESI